MATSNNILQNGWTTVPLDAGQLFDGQSYRTLPAALVFDDITFPLSDPIVANVHEYAKEKLPEKAYNHSMRVYYFATAILMQQFPEHAHLLSPSTLALTCLLHDIGTTDENMAATNMSFEFYGGIKSLNLLRELGSSDDQAEAICETIIRHQDLGTGGSITLLGQIIQLATVYDNAGDHPHVADLRYIIHQETLESVIQHFPRNGWLGCFAKTIQNEVDRKPWCHSTSIPDFKAKILGNKLMAPYE